MKEPGEPTAPATRKEHREIQRGRETKAAEGTNQNRAGFNIEKGVGNCKRKREKKKKKREVAGNKESSWRRAAVLGPSPSAFSAAGAQGCRGEQGLWCCTTL